MTYSYAITVRSQQGKNADYGRALERVAFFPGVTSAKAIGRDSDSITIGYNGREQPNAWKKFGNILKAECLLADGPLWEAASVLATESAGYWEHFHRAAPHVEATFMDRGMRRIG